MVAARSRSPSPTECRHVAATRPTPPERCSLRSTVRYAVPTCTTTYRRWFSSWPQPTTVVSPPPPTIVDSCQPSSLSMSNDDCVSSPPAIIVDDGMPSPPAVGSGLAKLRYLWGGWGLGQLLAAGVLSWAAPSRPGRLGGVHSGRYLIILQFGTPGAPRPPSHFGQIGYMGV